MIVDSHCHLDYLEKAGALEGALQRAEEAGVGLMLTIGTKLTEFPATLKLAEENNQVFCTVGVHPHEADIEGQKETDKLLAAAQHPKVVGIGETGLDFHYDHSDRTRQEASFLVHIEAARQANLPLIIHSRNADETMIRLLQQEHNRAPFRAVLRCFTSGPRLAEVALELGLYLSFSGIITFKSAAELSQIARKVPDAQLLIETDAPYLAPVPLRGSGNEPAFIVHTLAKLAALRGTSEEELASLTTENFFALFTKVPRAAFVT